MSGAGSFDRGKSEKSAKFWKNESGPFPGSAKPLAADLSPNSAEQGLSKRHALSMPATPKKQGKVQDAFLEFERSTQDAWDAGEDGSGAGEITAGGGSVSSGSGSSLLQQQQGSATVHIDPAVVRTTAEQVLQNHTRQRQAGGSPASAAAPLPDGKQRPNQPIGEASLTSASVQRPVHAPAVASTSSSYGISAKSSQAMPSARVGPASAASSATGKASGSSLGRLSATASADGGLRDQGRVVRFEQAVLATTTDLGELRQLGWSGIPRKLRPIVWKILSGYLPAVSDRRQPTLERKRAEYFGFIEQYFNTKYRDQHQETYRQIQIDVPRMNPLISLFQNKTVQQIFERILFIWAIRRPASGYVQGINDLVTPFFIVFLSEYTDTNIESPDADISSVSAEQLGMIEADSFWCLSKLLDSIQDNYTFAQLGIQRKINQLKDLVKRIDHPLYRHLEANGIEFLQFSFRWMNNLLMREMPLRCTVRLWDTYQSEPDGFASFHLYVCAAFLTTFSSQLLRAADFQHVMTLLQNLPTSRWTDSEVCELLAKAYQLKCMFADAPQHLKQHSSSVASSASGGS